LGDGDLAHVPPDLEAARGVSDRAAPGLVAAACTGAALDRPGEGEGVVAELDREVVLALLLVLVGLLLRLALFLGQSAADAAFGLDIESAERDVRRIGSQSLILGGDRRIAIHTLVFGAECGGTRPHAVPSDVPAFDGQADLVPSGNGMHFPDADG